MKTIANQVILKNTLSIAVAALLIGCGAQQSLSAANSTAANGTPYATRLADPSTQVDIQNTEQPASRGPVLRVAGRSHLVSRL